MTTPHDWADVLERAADHLDFATAQDEAPVRAALRTLAAAFQGAVPNSDRYGERDGEIILTLPEAP